MSFIVLVCVSCFAGLSTDNPTTIGSQISTEAHVTSRQDDATSSDGLTDDPTDTPTSQSNISSMPTSVTDSTQVEPGEMADDDNIVLEYPPYDGWYNNRANPSWGVRDSPILRTVPAMYADGCYKTQDKDNPNPLEVSDMLFNGSTGLPSVRNATVLLVFFGR